MNAIQSLILLVAVFALASAKCRGRREILVDDEFRYPRGCLIDDAENKSPCSYSLQWRKQNETIAFTWRAKLEMNQWVGFYWTKTVSLVNADAVVLSLISSNETDATPTPTIASPTTIAATTETTTSKPAQHTTKSPKPIRSQKQQQKQGHQKQKHSTTTTATPTEFSTASLRPTETTAGKPLELKLSPRLSSGIVDERGIVHEDATNDLFNQVWDFDHQSGFVTVKFERLLTGADSNDVDLKSTCPIWIFVPQPGMVIPDEKSSTAHRYQMVTSDSFFFYAYNPKCQLE